jgi:hypothetical protein
MAAQKGVRAQPANEAQLEEALRGLRYALSETRIMDGGFEKRTRSSFGQFGALAAQFATETDD